MHLFSIELKQTIWKIELISFYLAVLPTETPICNAITPGSIYLYSTLSQKEFKIV